MTGVLFASMLLSLSACQTSPKPVDCGEMEAELRAYTEAYLNALEDIGNLRQQLRASEEKRGI